MLFVQVQLPSVVMTGRYVSVDAVREDRQNKPAPRLAHQESKRQPSAHSYWMDQWMDQLIDYKNIITYNYDVISVNEVICFSN